jgi:hypothetical protein
MHESLHDLDEQDHEGEHQRDAEWREKPPARQEEALEKLFHDVHPIRLGPVPRGGRGRARLRRGARPELKRVGWFEWREPARPNLCAKSASRFPTLEDGRIPAKPATSRSGRQGSVLRFGNSAGEWLAEIPIGSMTVRFSDLDVFRVLDNTSRPGGGCPMHNPMRVLLNGDGAEWCSPLPKPRMSNEALARDAGWVRRDLQASKLTSKGDLRRHAGTARAVAPLLGSHQPRTDLTGHSVPPSPQ